MRKGERVRDWGGGVVIDLSKIQTTSDGSQVVFITSDEAGLQQEMGGSLPSFFFAHSKMIFFLTKILSYDWLLLLNSFSRLGI